MCPISRSGSDDPELANLSRRIHMQTATKTVTSPAIEGDVTQIRVLRSVAELETIRSYWQSWAGHPESGMDFYLTLLRSNPGILRPHVLAVYREGQPRTILVGRVDCGQIERLRIGYLSIKVHANSLFFVKGALRGEASPHDCELLIRELCNNLRGGEADLAYLNFLREDSSLYVHARKLPPFVCRDRICPSQLHFSATLPSTIDEFYLRFSPKVRKNKRWEAKKIAAEFSSDIKVSRIENVVDVDSLVDTAEKIAKTSYQRGIGVGFFDSVEERARLRQKAANGCLSAYVLYLGGQACAFWIGDVNDGVFGSDYLGFDPAYAKYSPGTYLILRVVESFCNESPRRTNRIDFGTGAAQYKELLADEVCNEIEVYIFAPSFKGVTLNAIKTLTVGANNVLKRTLQRTGLLQKIKKSWRGRLSDHQQNA